MYFLGEINVLVFARSPGTVSSISELGIRIYGYYWHYPPRDIPYRIYKKCKNSFIQAPYTEVWLSKRFGQHFDAIAFTYDEVPHMPYNVLHKLAANMKIGLVGRPNKKTLYMAIRKELRKHGT